MNEQELARRRHEYLISQLPESQEVARTDAIASRRGSYVTTIPCQEGHTGRRFTSSADCCVCYEEWKHRKAVEENRNRLAQAIEKGHGTYTRKGIGGLQPQAIPKH